MHRAGRALEHDAAGRPGQVADHDACSAAWSAARCSGWPGSPASGQRRHLGRDAPAAADPDRIVGVALLELDPHAGADLRHHVRCPSACRRPARRASPSWRDRGRRRRAPAPGGGRSASGSMLLSDRCRDTCRSTSCPSLMPAPSASIETRPLRVSVKLCLYSPRLIVW